MNHIQTLLFISLAYFLGCFCGGYYLVRFFTGKDIRELGSGNPGARNVGRLFGFKGFLISCFCGVARKVFWRFSYNPFSDHDFSYNWSYFPYSVEFSWREGHLFISWRTFSIQYLFNCHPCAIDYSDIPFGEKNNYKRITLFCPSAGILCNSQV
jgi:hypothetical protein